MRNVEIWAKIEAALEGHHRTIKWASGMVPSGRHGLDRRTVLPFPRLSVGPCNDLELERQVRTLAAQKSGADSE